MDFRRIFRAVQARSSAERCLLAETAVSLVAAWVLVRGVPFNWWSQRLGDRRAESSESEQTQTLTLIAGSIAAVASQLPWTSTCLMDALAAKWMLNRRDISNTLYFGVRTAESAGQDLFAHAWLCVGTQFVAGEVGAGKYTVIVKFTSP
jgi:hypothetical protein